jgi:hypothetical protein
MQKSSQQNLITPAFVLSIIGGVLSVFFIALSIFGVVVLYQQKDTFIDKLTDELLKDNPSSDYDSAHAVATIT